MMLTRTNKIVCPFDKYNLMIPKGFKCHSDSFLNKRLLFFTDDEERITISFEMEMPLMDMIQSCFGGSETVSYQLRENGRYVHFKRPKGGRYAFFHIEIKDDRGKTLYLPGQMTVDEGYIWNDGVEPVVVDIMKSLAIRIQ